MMWKHEKQHSSLSSLILTLRFLIYIVPDTSGAPDILNPAQYGLRADIGRSEDSHFESQSSQVKKKWKRSDASLPAYGGWTDGRSRRVEEYMSDLHGDWSPDGRMVEEVEQQKGAGKGRGDATMGFQSSPERYGQYPAGNPHSRCIDIPPNLGLCRSVGYRQMRLPNLLEHTTVPEVLQQASPWVSLVNVSCHPDTQLLLCSLFAPVCLETLGTSIMPCRSLCEKVREGCEGWMLKYGFPWPDMLKCDKFPPDQELCISMQKTEDTEHKSETSNNEHSTVPVCHACSQPATVESFVNAHCTADFAVRLKVKKFHVEGRDLRLQVTSSSRLKILKSHRDNTTTADTFRSSSVLLEDGASCSCPDLAWSPEANPAVGSREGRQSGSQGEVRTLGKKGGTFFLSGRSMGNRILVTFLQKIDNGQRVKDSGKKTDRDGKSGERVPGAFPLDPPQGDRRATKRVLKEATRALRKKPELCRSVAEPPEVPQRGSDRRGGKQKPANGGKDRKTDKNKKNKNNRNKLNDRNTMNRKNQDKKNRRNRKNNEQ